VPERWSDLRERYALASADFLALVGGLDAEAAMQPNVGGVWSTKEIVAHLAGWLWESDRRFRNHFTENGQDMPPIGDSIDAFNASAVAERRDLSWQETLDELRRADMTFAASVAKITESEHAADERYANWLNAIADDYRDHGKQVQAWQKKVARS
jgi:DinB superfamily